MSYSEKPPTPQEALAHFGVKGMKWGVRNNETIAGVSPKTNREARKDAQEFARAKMFFGEGAGTRRKLIKATVEGKSRKDPAYKKAFDHHLAKQDLSEHASKARSERKGKDRRAKTGRLVRGTRHVLNGNSQFASASVAIGVGGALAAHRAGIDKVVFNTAKQTVGNLRRTASGSSYKQAEQFLRSMGL